MTLPALADTHTALLLADVVLTLHVAVVLFVVGGLLLIIAGGLRHWRWVRAPLLRLLHLLAIGFVAAESWLGLRCPLTTLEMWLRAQAGVATYSETFITHWLQRLLYYDLPPWYFQLGYTLFGVLVLVAWLFWPPRFGNRGE